MALVYCLSNQALSLFKIFSETHIYLHIVLIIYVGEKNIKQRTTIAKLRQHSIAQHHEQQ